MYNMPYNMNGINGINNIPNYYNSQNNMVSGYGLKQEIIRVNGENGARTYQLQPNSSVLLLDESAPIVWLAQTDGAGYKTVSAYEIKPYEARPEIDLCDLETRIKRIEDMINESNFTNTSTNKPNQKHN